MRISCIGGMVMLPSCLRHAGQRLRLAAKTGDLILDVELALFEPADQQVVGAARTEQHRYHQVQIVMLVDQAGEPDRASGWRIVLRMDSRFVPFQGSHGCILSMRKS